MADEADGAVKRTARRAQVARGNESKVDEAMIMEHLAEAVD